MRVLNIRDRQLQNIFEKKLVKIKLSNLPFISEECRTDRLLSGRHYNNAMRALKYLYNSFSRQRNEHLQNWLAEQNDRPNLSKLTESVEFKNLIEEVSLSR